MSNNFFNTCILNKEYLPEKECPEGVLRVKSRNIKGCMWFINSEEDKYCFWKWVQRKSDSEGEMTPIPNKEIPELLKLPVTKSSQLLAEAIENFKKIEGFSEFKSFLIKTK